MLRLPEQEHLLERKNVNVNDNYVGLSKPSNIQKRHCVAFAH